MAAPAEMKAAVVVVPVLNEEALLERCITALATAVEQVLPARQGGPHVRVILVLDSCSDESANLAHSSPFEVAAVKFRNVGKARGFGVERALFLLGQTDPAHIWIASTDGDSAVPPHWLEYQLDVARTGIELMIGTVRPDRADLDARQWAAWSATHVPGQANGHVHGANLGIRADRYRDAGGFPGVAEHEDVRLVERVRAAGARILATDDCWVLTSGRRAGRTAGGYARHLRQTLPPDDTSRTVA